MDILPTLTSWTFEEVCRQGIRAGGGPLTCDRVGRWWHDGNEIDVVGLDEETESLLLGECKWTNDPVDLGLLARLEALAPEVRWRGRDRKVIYGLFSRRGFTEELIAASRERDDLFLRDADGVLKLF